MSNNSQDELNIWLDTVLAGAEEMELPLCEESGQPIGVMRPLSSSHLDQMDVMERMTDWRNANMSNFLTHFEATPVRTRAWVENVLLKTRAQMLWLVYDQNNNLVGHFGFKNLTPQSVLLDNAIRGERNGHPKLFVVAGRALVTWLFRRTGVHRIDGIVMAENVPAMMMNRQIGLHGWKRHPLIKRTINGDTHWDIGKDGESSPDGRYCFTLFINRSADYPAPT